VGDGRVLWQGAEEETIFFLLCMEAGGVGFVSLVLFYLRAGAGGVGFTYYFSASFFPCGEQ